MASNNILKSAHDNGLEQHTSYTLLIVPYQQTGLKCENVGLFLYFRKVIHWFWLIWFDYRFAKSSVCRCYQIHAILILLTFSKKMNARNYCDIWCVCLLVLKELHKAGYPATMVLFLAGRSRRNIKKLPTWMLEWMMEFVKTFFAKFQKACYQNSQAASLG